MKRNTTQLRFTIFFFTGLIFLTTLGSCGWVKNIGKGGIHDISQMTKSELDEIQGEIFPLDSASKRIIMGILEGAATPASRNNIDTLSKNLSNSITKYLNERLKTLDTKSVGSGLVTGLMDTLNSRKTKDDLRNLINASFSDLDRNLNRTITSLIDTITSTATKAKLAELGAALFTDANADKLNSFLNKSLNGAIRFDSLGDAIRQDLLDIRMKEAVAGIMPPQIDSLLTQTQRILDTIENESEGFWSKHIWTIVISIAALMLLGTLLYFWRTGKGNTRINDLLMAEINKMDNQEAYDELTGRIWKNAIQNGVQGDLKKRLDDVGLLGDEKWSKSK